MKKTNRVGLALALLALGTGLAGTIYADQVEEARKLVVVQNTEALKAFDASMLRPVIDPGKVACYKIYQDRVQAVRNILAGCMNTPPPGSPLAKFNALTNAQLATFCGAKTLQQCVADVTAQQLAFCKATTHYQQALDAALAAEKACLECDTLRDKKAALLKEIAAIDQQLAAKHCPK